MIGLVVAIVALVFAVTAVSVGPLAYFYIREKQAAQDEDLAKQLADINEKRKAVEDIGERFFTMQKELTEMKRAVNALQVKNGMRNRPFTDETKLGQ